MGRSGAAEGKRLALDVFLDGEGAGPLFGIGPDVGPVNDAGRKQGQDKQSKADDQ
jgi:hypothetical protein